MTTTPNFYLASTEGYDIEFPRECYIQNKNASSDRSNIIVVSVQPSISFVDKQGVVESLTKIALTPRHQGVNLLCISDWPVYVHVIRLPKETTKDSLVISEPLEIIAWAELYKSFSDAKNKVM